MIRKLVMELDAEFGHRDITAEVEALVDESSLVSGQVTLGLVGSTGGITTIEYEPGALMDLQEALQRIAPTDGFYHHNARWGDGNGFSHLRSSVIGTDLTVAVLDGKLQLGTWQQILVLNFDNRPRTREVVVVLIADE